MGIVFYNWRFKKARQKMTNGDKLLSVFDGALIYGTHKEKGIIKVCVDNSYINPFDLDWWNSEYTESEDK